MILTKKLSFIVLLSLISYFSLGQKHSVHKKNKSFLGLTGGVNFTLPSITDRYYILTSIETADGELFDKKYDKFFQNGGTQFGIHYSYNFTNSISVIGGFGYQSVGFNYFTDYSWVDTANNHELNREMHHLQKISYFTVPIMVRWDIVTRGQLVPFVQGGVFMNFRHQAKKSINYDNTIDGEETENDLSSSSIVSISDYTRKFNMGLTGGIGLNYYTKYFTVGLESNFRYGFFKIMNDETRYSDLNGFALQYLDVMDQMRMSNLNVQLSLAVPIDHSISTNILRRKRYNKKR
ncbi:MAG: outer membrane beta-barrel protein [Crocinitomicaceae bacterium]